MIRICADGQLVHENVLRIDRESVDHLVASLTTLRDLLEQSETFVPFPAVENQLPLPSSIDLLVSRFAVGVKVDGKFSDNASVGKQSPYFLPASRSTTRSSACSAC